MKNGHKNLQKLSKIMKQEVSQSNQFASLKKWRGSDESYWIFYYIISNILVGLLVYMNALFYFIWTLSEKYLSPWQGSVLGINSVYKHISGCRASSDDLDGGILCFFDSTNRAHKI